MGEWLQNNLLMQFQSDILDKSIHSQEINEITALGVGVASYLYVWICRFHQWEIILLIKDLES